MSVQTVILTANQTNTSSTLVDVSELSFTVNAGVTYQFRFMMVFTLSTSAFGTISFKAGITFPTSTIMAATARMAASATASATGEIQGQITSSGDAVSGGNNNDLTVSTNYLAVIAGTIKPSTSGTLQIQMARGGTGVGTATIKANSDGILQPVL